MASGCLAKKITFSSLAIIIVWFSAQRPNLLMLCATYCVSRWQFLAAHELPSKNRYAHTLMSSQHSLDKYFITRRMASTRSAMRFFRTQHNMTLLRPTSSLPRKRPDVGRRQGAPGLRDGSAVRCCDTWCKSAF